MATTGHESEHITVEGLKGALQQLKTDLLPSVPRYVSSPSGTAGSTASGSYNRAQWAGTIDNVTALATGMVVLYKIPVAGVNKGVTLNINSLGEHPVCANVNTNMSTMFGVGCIIPLVYDADQKASVYVDNTSTEFTGCWKMADYVDGNIIPQGYCETAAATQAKTASCTNFALANKSYIMVVIRYANSYNGKITLNINGTGAKDVYINGTVSSSSNKTLAAGSYLVYYQDSKFYFRTDGKITGSITGDAATVNGKTVAENVPSGAVFTDTTYSAATTSAAGLMSADDKTKLNGIATGATKVTTDTVSGWGYTKNTGTITGIKMNGASKGTSGVVDLGTVITAHQDISGKVDKTTTVNGHALSGNVSVTKSDVGLGNVTNDSQVKRSEMGAASGVATLDSAGKVPTSQLPSYVDDVLEYDTKPDFPATGEAGKIYVDKSTNTSWRWSGTTYVQIKGDLVIGTTTGTAADGGVANTHYNNTSNPHSVTKAQVGLGSVVNTGDSATPVSGGTTKFTTGGAYTELNKKVDKVSGKGLSTNDYTTDEKNKLAGIAAGAEVNVQSDWNATSGDAFIKNKPTIPDSFQWFGTSSTAAATVQKEVSIPSITSLKTGQIIVVMPTVTSTVADSTLKLNSFDAYPMRYNNAAITTSTDSIVWSANIPSLFVFDGSYWVFLGHGTDLNAAYTPLTLGFCYGECSTAAGTAAKTVTMSKYSLVAHGIVSIRFTNAITVANATLNINSRGAKAIYYQGAALEANVVGAGNTVVMQYDGSRYQIINIEPPKASLVFASDADCETAADEIAFVPA